MKLFKYEFALAGVLGLILSVILIGSGLASIVALDLFQIALSQKADVVSGIAFSVFVPFLFVGLPTLLFTSVLGGICWFSLSWVFSFLYNYIIKRYSGDNVKSESSTLSSIAFTLALFTVVATTIFVLLYPLYALYYIPIYEILVLLSVSIVGGLIWSTVYNYIIQFRNYRHPRKLIPYAFALAGLFFMSILLYLPPWEYILSFKDTTSRWPLNPKLLLVVIISSYVFLWVWARTYNYLVQRKEAHEAV